MSVKKDNFKIETAGTVVTCTCTDDDAFFEGDLSKKEIQAVFHHAQGYIEKCATTASDMATEIMADDSKITDVVFNMPYGISKRGSVDIKTRRSVTFPGIGKNPDVTRSDLRVVVKDPLAKISKTKLKDFQARMTAELLS